MLNVNDVINNIIIVIFAHSSLVGLHKHSLYNQGSWYVVSYFIWVTGKTVVYFKSSMSRDECDECNKLLLSREYTT